VRDVAGWVVHSAPGLAARATGRLLRRTPAAVAHFFTLAAVGARWLSIRLVRYVVAYPDFADVVREAIEENQPRRAKHYRDAWRRAAGGRLFLLATAAVLAWQTIDQLVHRFGVWAVVLLVVGLLVVLAAVGRAVRPESEDGSAPDDRRAEEGPFPIADAHTRAEAASCVARAVTAEGIDLRAAGEALRQRWGWQVPVILRRGKPADLVAKLNELETTLDLPAGGLLAAPDRSRRARIVLRLAQRDPFTDLPPAEHHAPASLSIRDSHVIAQRMDGTDLRLCLLGVHVVVIGVPGSGKSITLRALANVVSACTDAIVWDLDPAGNGLDILDGAVARKERDPAGIEHALATAVSYAEARPGMLSPLDMGDAWQPSHDYPAVIVFVDEYTRLTERAKNLAVELLRTGRKARITLVLAASEATSDALGAAIAESVAVKILHPCRHHDIRLVLGQGMIAEGWRPDRLNPASGDAIEDAGKCYVYAAGSREPIISKVRHLDRQQAWDNGTHRAATGLPTLDAHTLHAARTRQPTSSTGETAPQVDGQVMVDVLTASDGAAKLWTDDILTRLSTIDTRYQGWDAEQLASVLRPLGVTPTQVKINGRNRNGYHLDALAQAWRAHQRGGGPH
jgi:S-DNA-T family DNA segregation ATPase FtsK/SpoIIIE